MSRRKVDRLANIAAGRRVVLSAGTLDGPFLAALQRLQLAPLGDGAVVSSWAAGIGDNHQVKGNDDGNDQTG